MAERIQGMGVFGAWGHLARQQARSGGHRHHQAEWRTGVRLPDRRILPL